MQKSGGNMQKSGAERIFAWLVGFLHYGGRKMDARRRSKPILSVSGGEVFHISWKNFRRKFGIRDTYLYAHNRAGISPAFCFLMHKVIHKNASSPLTPTHRDWNANTHGCNFFLHFFSNYLSNQKTCVYLQPKSYKQRTHDTILRILLFLLLL